MNTTVFNVNHFCPIDEIKSALSSYKGITIAELAIEKRPDKLNWMLPNINFTEQTCIWIGNNNQTFFNLNLTIHGKYLLYLYKE